MVTNGQPLDCPIELFLLEFEVVDFRFQKNYTMMKTLPNPLLGLCFLQRHSTKSHNIPNTVISTTPRTQPQYPSIDISADRNYLHPSTWRNSSNIHQNAAFDRPQGIHQKQWSELPHPNFSDMPYTLPIDTYMAVFRVLTPGEIKHIKPADPSTLTIILHQHMENTDVYLNQLVEVDQPRDEQATYWFPTPEQPGMMTDASFNAAGYGIMIEDDPNQKLQSSRENYAPIAFGSKTFTQHN